MKPIPQSHDGDEFSLRIRWLRLSDGASIPGFHLKAGFANEGTSHWVAEDVRIGAQALTNVLTMLGGDPNVDSTIMNLGGPLADQHDDALRLYHVHLVTKARKLREDLAAAEEAVKAAGLEGAL